MLYYVSFIFATPEITGNQVKSYNVRVVDSLPADILWGSFVTHSFLPHRGEDWFCERKLREVFVFETTKTRTPKFTVKFDQKLGGRIGQKTI